MLEAEYEVLHFDFVAIDDPHGAHSPRSSFSRSSRREVELRDMVQVKASMRSPSLAATPFLVFAGPFLPVHGELFIRAAEHQTGRLATVPNLLPKWGFADHLPQTIASEALGKWSQRSVFIRRHGGVSPPARHVIH